MICMCADDTHVGVSAAMSFCRRAQPVTAARGRRDSHTPTPGWSKVSPMRERRGRGGRTGSAGVLLLACAASVALIAAVDAQPPSPTPAGPVAPVPGRTVVTSPRDAYPPRSADDPAAIERGRALY